MSAAALAADSSATAASDARHAQTSALSQVPALTLVPALVPVPATSPARAPVRATPSPYAKRGPLGDPTPLVCTVAKSALEIALGTDGIDHLARWITPTLRTMLLRQQSLSRRAGYTPRGKVSIARVRLCRVSSTAVEVGVVATEGDVAHALALRLEAVSGRWLVTALDVG